MMLHSTHTIKSSKKVENKLQYGADNAKDRSRKNKMHIHRNKTSYMILGALIKFSEPPEFNIKID